MLKIAVFDGGIGAAYVAEFLETEICTAEVIPVIDWHSTPYACGDWYVIQQRAEEMLRPFVGKVDLIVIGGYVASLALQDIASKYPEQKFVGMPANFQKKTQRRAGLRDVLLLMNEPLISSELWRRAQLEIPLATIAVPDCAEWDYQIDIGEMSAERLYSDLEPYFAVDELDDWSLLRQSVLSVALGENALDTRLANPGLSLCERFTEFVSQGAFGFRPELAFSYGGPACLEGRTLMSPEEFDLAPKFSPDTILLLDTHLWGFKAELEKLFGLGVRVLDFRDQLLHDVCLALKLRGVDGVLGR